MNTGRTVFSQLVEFLPHQQFHNCLDRYGGGRYLKSLSCWDQYLAMAFAQLTYRESLRDIEACLGSIGSKLYHMGFRGKVVLMTVVLETTVSSRAGTERPQQAFIAVV